MTGTGTQQDPFVVDNFDDFLTAAATDGAYVAFDSTATTKVIDINDTDYVAGLTAAITLNCAHIDGNDWEIRNLYVNRDDINLLVVPSGKNTVISHLKLLNIVFLSSGTKPVFDLYACEWSNCAFSGMYSCTSESTNSAKIVNSNVGDNMKMSCCALHFDVSVKRRHQIFNYGVYDTCNMQIDMNVSAAETIRYIFYTAKVTNCILRGTLHFTASGGTGLFTACTVRTSYAAMTVTADDSVTPSLNLIASSYATVCFYDSSLIGAGVSVNKTQSNMKSLTTAQCKDAAYLTSIGFACGETAD